MARVQCFLCCQRIQSIIDEVQEDMGISRFLEGALLVAELHFPFHDFTDVFSFIFALSEELKRRMAARNVTGGLPALKLLSDLLFGPPPPSLSGNGGGLHYQETLDGIPGPWDWDSEKAALVVPPDGYGVGLKGEEIRYHDRHNSFIPYVLTRRRGLPITLAVIHAAVGRGAGLQIECISAPKHFLNKFGPVGHPDERFIDVFYGGRFLTRAEAWAQLQELDPINGVREDALNSVGPLEVYTRMGINLAREYLESGGRTTNELRSVLKFLLTLQPTAREFRFLHARLAEADNDWQTAQEDWMQMVPSPVSTGELIRQMMTRARERGRQHEEDCKLPRRRPQDGRVLYRVGEIMQHLSHGYNGVIIGWDEQCMEEEDWMQTMGVERLKGGGKEQPFYNVLVDERQRPSQTTYVAQVNMVVRTPSSAEAMGSIDLPIRHPEVGMYFDGYMHKLGRYQPNAFLCFRYPDDWGSPGCDGSYALQKALRKSCLGFDW
eukprot:jgi/Botrbrau1/12149/Bobra.0186s0061.1